MTTFMNSIEASKVPVRLKTVVTSAILNNTTATPSFAKLSPSTIMDNRLFKPRALKILRTETGSVAAINAPKISACCRERFSRKYIRKETIKNVKNVPTNDNNRIGFLLRFSSSIGSLSAASPNRADKKITITVVWKTVSVAA
ncbi:hypothetical protein SRABI80_04864 [Peribacillus frigoritolerans]|nr:hypothetical protein SRABI80_04864 [Peribacillus frigoritolerans]